MPRPINPDMDDFDVATPRKRTSRHRTYDDYEDTDEPYEQPRKSQCRPQVKPDSEGPRRPKRAAATQKRRSGGNGGLIGFIRDQRLHLSVGIVLCVCAIVSVVMCISFMMENAADQSVTFGRTPQQIVEADDTLGNAGKAIGALVAGFMMVETFGIGSFALAFYVFMLGLACFGKVRLRFWSLSFRCIFLAVAVSIIIGLLTINRAATFPLGGEHGQYINTLLIDYAGALGAFAVSVILAGLLVAVFLHPIKAFMAAIRRILPARAKVQQQPAAQAVKGTVATIEDLETTATESDNEPENAPAIEPAIEAPQADIDQLGQDEGFSIDEPSEPFDSQPTATETTIPVAVEPEEKTEAIIEDVPPTTAAEEAAPAKIETTPGEPELIIRTAPAENGFEEDAAQEIHNGDHMGLETLYDPRAGHSSYQFPSTELLLDRSGGIEVDAREQASNKQMIVNALKSYNIEIVRIEATIGPTVTLYEIVPTEGTRIAKIKSLEDDIAMSLSATGIRIIAPMPGRGTIGIEVPNLNPQIVSMRKVLESSAFRSKKAKMQLPVALGATISNDMFIEDLAKMPHLLVAGATGQGKSVGLNCIITSLLYSKHPDELKFVLIDPKMVEFSLYRDIANQYMAKLPEEDNAIITDPQKVVATLTSLCTEMDRRYELLSDAYVRDVVAYNDRFQQRRLNPEKGHRYMPYIVMIVDEFADLITTAGKDISLPIARIAQKGRAAGMHMIIATQRPSTDIITGMIKANFPARIAFRVLSSIDSKTILDRPGAHRLIGRGDMLTLINGGTERVQCAFVDTDEIEAICSHISSQPGFIAPYELPEVIDENSGGNPTVDINLRNEEFRRCALFIASQTQASITILQRKFQIGFNKAGRYMDQMEALGIVGPANGAKPRQVTMGPEEVQRLLGDA